jgi:hypothetical protein
MVWSVLHAVIDDSISDRDLHLLRMCPSEWISAGAATEFIKVPTKYGVVDLRFQLSSDHLTLSVNWRGQWHHRPRNVILHGVPGTGVKWIVANGRRYRAAERINL